MANKPIVPRLRARQDMASAVRHYRVEAGVVLAERLANSIEAALHALAAHPLAGSLSHGAALAIVGLRSWRVERFPYLIFYMDRADWVEIWRVLHVRRDVETILRDQA